LLPIHSNIVVSKPLTRYTRCNLWPLQWSYLHKI